MPLINNGQTSLEEELDQEQGEQVVVECEHQEQKDQLEEQKEDQLEPKQEVSPVTTAENDEQAAPATAVEEEASSTAAEEEASSTAATN